MQDVEIKKMGGNATYGFVLYYDLVSAITAKQYMDGQNLRGNAIRVSICNDKIICTHNSMKNFAVNSNKEI